MISMDRKEATRGSLIGNCHAGIISPATFWWQ
jgi:hypothetical protein